MIIVSSDLQSKFENEYIEKVLIPKSENIIKVNPKKFFDLDESIVNNSKLTVVYTPSSEKIYQEIDTFLNKINITYSLIHLSDEGLEGENNHYKNAEFVLRSYFDPRIKKKECFTIPLGFQSGYLNKNNNQINSERKYTWSFFGQIYSTRKNMINNLEPFKPYFLHDTQGFMTKDALETKEIIKIYNETIFAPCPYGFINPDTFRIMETLEYGCIPIVQKFNNLDYYKYIFGDHPFIIVKNWNEVGEVINHYLKNADLLKKKQIEVQNWYKNFKFQLESDLSELFDGNLELINSRQFNYQNQRKLNIFRNLTFIYWFVVRRNKLYIAFSKFIYKTKKLLTTRSFFKKF